MLHEKIMDIKKRLTEYGTLVEKMIEKSVDGLVRRDKAILDEVIEKDETRANEFEIELDELCTVTSAQYEPRGRDLRTILMIMKMNSDLERVGDHAVNIAKSALYLIEKPEIKPFVDLPKMVEVTLRMLKNSITAFVDEDAALARKVCKEDDIVDDLRDHIMNELITLMKADSHVIKRSFHLINIAKNLERVADLSTNICEDVIFMVAGRVIKHHKEDFCSDGDKT